MDSMEEMTKLSRGLSILEALTRLYNAVEGRKEICRQVCSDCQKLLKPWPLSRTGNIETDLASMCLNEENAQVRHEDKQGDPLPPAEQKEISLVDEMLTKAQKARAVQNKLQARKNKHPLRNNSDLGGGENKGSADNHSDDRQSELTTVLHLPDIKSVKKEESYCDKNTHELKKPAVISKQKLDRLLTSTHTKSQNKSTSSFKPAHRSAPFKTESATVRRPVSQRPKSTVKQTRSANSQRQDLIHRQKVTDAKEHQKNNPQSKVLKKDGADKIQGNQNENVKNTAVTDVKETVNENCSNSLDVQRLAGKTDLLQCVTEALDSQSEKSCAQDVTRPPKSFDIRKEGSNLSVPQKLKRLWMSNLKLREKMSMQSLTRSSPSLKEEFIAKLKTHMDSHEEKDNYRYKRLCEYLENHNHWENILHKYDPLKIDEESTWDDVLRSRRALEFICTRLDETNEDFSSLLMDLHLDDAIATPSSLPSLPFSKESCLWFSVGKEYKVPIPSKPIKYSKFQDLLKYQELLHTIQTLQIELYIMEKVENEVLPIFVEMKSGDQNLYRLYRNIYSLLCTEGTRFPAMVFDEESTSSSEEEGSDF